MAARVALLAGGVALFTLASPSCAETDGSPAVAGGASGDLGVEGASCVKSPDCEPPLQCIDLVCTGLGVEGADGSADAANAGADGGAAESEGPDQSDTTGAGGRLSEPPEGDSVGPGPRVTDIPEEVNWDAEDVTFVDTDEEGPDPLEDAVVFSECEELGIEPVWEGDFVGTIAFDIDTGGLASPEQGTILVGGDLGFEIQCIDSKLVVQGLLDGSGSVIGQESMGDFPFEVGLQGFYSPSTQSLTAQLADGVVVIYGLLEVYFEGSLEGSVLPDGTFQGTWEGGATGTNVPGFTGIADGIGGWTAEAQ